MSVIIVIVLSMRAVLIRVIKGTHHGTSHLKLILDEKEELKSNVLCFLETCFRAYSQNYRTMLNTFCSLHFSGMQDFVTAFVWLAFVMLLILIFEFLKSIERFSVMGFSEAVVKFFLWVFFFFSLLASLINQIDPSAACHFLSG